MSTNDYVKYVTQQVVRYIDQPKAQRKHTKQTKRAQRDPFVTRWFGILPFAFQMIMKRNRKSK
ncbi:YqzE family protein [Bacillus sp. HMF5848]|uniref:YqzE family protein n=1 Tax=Bacillus sp. HMF5848 TaxID=2495421 RepID=UPI000F797C3A|nr:YqzE family protein [Bacillus sp. HMF5848]RSK27824.1 YqzE family protein [Bacillus sp. HMF5848]